MTIRISAKQDGFRRCGVAHSKTAVEYPDGHWTDEQISILAAEPMLVVTADDGEQNKATNRLTAAEAIKLVKAVTTVKDLNTLTTGEDRKSVLDAIEQRLAELTAQKEG